MAEVYRAWDRRERRWCAVKQLRLESCTKVESRKRFLRECRTMVRLEHRNVIAAWDVVDQHQPYLVMELADGGSLEQWVSRHGPMPPRMAVDAAIQVCKGVGAAHKANVIHRDLKPHNILVDRKGYCKVTDFGIAMLVDLDGTTDIPDARLTATKGLLGTLAFMAPEQKSNPRLADVRTDVYGIGATLYTLLTAETRTDLFVVEREPDLLDSVPEVLRPILSRAVAYKPEARFESVHALARALYDSRSFLRTDPARTPALVGPIDPDPDPPEDDLPTLTTETPGYTRGPRVPDPAPLSGGSPVQTVPSLPSISRRATPPEPEPEVSRLPRLLLRAVASFVVLLGLPLSLDVMWMTVAKRAHDEALNDWLSAVQVEVSLSHDLEALGADIGPLRQTFADQQGVRPPVARAKAATLYLQQAQLAFIDAKARASEQGRDVGTLGYAQQSLLRLRGSQEAWVTRLGAWQTRGGQLPGSFVVAMRLVARPPVITVETP